ncbi:hypothetical protein [Microbulbifer halophilus]|uniref:Uncharacterized protein n=2 Tax=Microbulbifer halophilus TaxID=453963 RepID=A0ABW5EJB6_9GAMM|nr:hypothetical protein [Microbulbifer halophilus]MCW8127354.1 hypothetical protein [Microbulbifer halophilus]
MQQQKFNHSTDTGQSPDTDRVAGVDGNGDLISAIQYKRVRQQLILVWAAISGLLLALLIMVIWSPARESSLPPVVTVERLEVVEPDGSPAMILANSQRPAAATIDGQLIMEGQAEERKGTPSIIFFDGKGDEVGGMLFGTRETPDGYQAGRHLSFDGYGQDQTVVLAHYQDSSGSRSGLTISDRPSHSLLETFDQLGLEPGASREQMRAAIESIPEDRRASRTRELFGTTRAFLGSAPDGEARLELKDGQGRPRILIETPEDGEPAIRILDETGETVLQLPG